MQQTVTGAQQAGAPQSQAPAIAGAETASPIAITQLIKNLRNILRSSNSREKNLGRAERLPTLSASLSYPFAHGGQRAAEIFFGEGVCGWPAGDFIKYCFPDSHNSCYYSDLHSSEKIREAFMWETTDGCRALTRPEARLFVLAAIRLADDYESYLDAAEDEESPQLGVRLFDQLTVPQQLVLLHRVTKFLLDPEIPAPERSALLDAVVAAVFQYVVAELQSEIYSQEDLLSIEEQDTSVRHLISEAYHHTVEALDMSPPEPFFCPDPECCVYDNWELVIESLHGRICDDDDWAMADAFLDLPPEEGRALKEVLGISSDYFTDIPEDLTAFDGSIARERLLVLHDELFPELKRSPCAGEGDAGKETTGQEAVEIDIYECIDAIENAPDDWAYFVDVSVGKVVSLPDCLLDKIEEMTAGQVDKSVDEKHARLAMAIRESSNFKPLPAKDDIHEWGIMREFCNVKAPKEHRPLLAAAIRGPGAFRRFNQCIAQLGSVDCWRDYRRNAMSIFMMDWLSKHQIPWQPPF